MTTYTGRVSTRIASRGGLSLSLAVALMLASLGCSFWYSSRSLSKSSKGISKSVSKSVESSSGSISASSKSKEARYRDDVEEYTEAWVSSGTASSGGDFLGGIGSLADQRGITDWESDAVTWRGIGGGLRRAKLSQAQVEAYKRSWADGNEARMDLIQRGYDGRR